MKSKIMEEYVRRQCTKTALKYKRFKKVAWIHWTFKMLVGKFTWGNKAKYCWGMSTNFLFSKVCWQRPTMFCHLHLKQTFPPIIWVFPEEEGDGFESRLPFKTFSTLPYIFYLFSYLNPNNKNSLFFHSRFQIKMSSCLWVIPYPVHLYAAESIKELHGLSPDYRMLNWFSKEMY